MNIPYGMFLTIQLMHLTCRKDRVQSRTRNEGRDLSKEQVTTVREIIQDEEQYDDTFKERKRS